MEHKHSGPPSATFTVFLLNEFVISQPPLSLDAPRCVQQGDNGRSSAKERIARNIISINTLAVDLVMAGALLTV